MGNCDFKKEKPEEIDNNIVSKQMYNFQYIIGRGGFGKVYHIII